MIIIIVTAVETSNLTNQLLILRIFLLIDKKRSRRAILLPSQGEYLCREKGNSSLNRPCFYANAPFASQPVRLGNFRQNIDAYTCSVWAPFAIVAPMKQCSNSRRTYQRFVYNWRHYFTKKALCLCRLVTVWPATLCRIKFVNINVF
jgi:hypothetical protein